MVQWIVFVLLYVMQYADDPHQARAKETKETPNTLYVHIAHM